MDTRWGNKFSKNRLLFQEIWWLEKADIRGVGREILLKDGSHLFKLIQLCASCLTPVKQRCLLCLPYRGVMKFEWNNICQLTLKTIAL